jgi:hypothetical protein
LWPALRLRHGWAERRFVNFQQMRGWENPFPRTGSARLRSGDYTKSQRSAALKQSARCRLGALAVLCLVEIAK